MRPVFALVALAVALLVAGCGGAEETQPLPEGVTGTTTQETTTEAETETEGDGEEGQGDAEAGADVYASAGCGSCHTLEAAGSSGTIGPNLDDSQPSHDLVVDRVTNGAGAMPPFKDQLTEQQIQDVAAYVVESTS
ncbi:MAG: cytochrome c [Thermoleophilia bacterium]|nr:cytochrome c [Thermoleophilia bacterium]